MRRRGLVPRKPRTGGGLIWPVALGGPTPGLILSSLAVVSNFLQQNTQLFAPEVIRDPFLKGEAAVMKF